MADWAMVNEVVVSVVGGVLTAIVLGIFTRRKPRQDVDTAQLRAEDRPKPSRVGSAFSSLLQMILAVGGGVAFAMLGGRWLFQSGILERSLPMRMGLLVGATTIIWLMLSAMRKH